MNNEENSKRPYCASLYGINNILLKKIVVDRRIFVKCTNLMVNYKDEKRFLLKFDQLCQNVYKLVINDKIPIDIAIKFKNINKSDIIKQMLCLVEHYFKESILLSHYAQAQCNKNICLPKIKPNISFDTEHSVFYASNCRQEK